MGLGGLLLLLIAGFYSFVGCGVGSEAVATTGSEAAIPGWVKRNHLPKNAVPGARIFAVAGCETCHTYVGTGASNLGAPDLSAEGAKGKGIQFQVAHLKCPSCVSPGSPMPHYETLGEDNLRKLAIFLEASIGPR